MFDNTIILCIWLLPVTLQIVLPLAMLVTHSALRMLKAVVRHA